MVINIHQAKTHLSRLLERVAQGDEIIIGKAGKPIAKLVPFRETRTRRKPGGWKGRVHIAPDFDQLPEDVARAFRGESA